MCDDGAVVDMLKQNSWKSPLRQKGMYIAVNAAHTFREKSIQVTVSSTTCSCYEILCAINFKGSTNRRPGFMRFLMKAMEYRHTRHRTETYSANHVYSK